ncbi:MAG: glycosyltransferase family 2 protein [Pyrinomonadaceae bacterium]
MGESKQTQLTVSVIMPVRNEADFIERSFRSVLAQDYPHALLEIIIADGLSTDATRDLIESMKASSDIAIRIVDNPELIASTGLNRAIAVAEGEIIVRVDGHCEISADYVANCVRLLKQNKAEGVGGPIETIGENLPARAISVAMSSSFGVGGSAFRCISDREMFVDTVAFPGYRSEVFRKIGLFNEGLVRNQDDEFNYRLRKSGGRILLSPDIRSKYYSRSNFRNLWRQYFQYGYWKVRILQLHPRQMSLRQFVPLGFVTAIIVLGFLALVSSFAGWALFAGLFVYLFTGSAAASAAIGRIGIKGLPLVILAFIILHVSYGSGFLVGLFVFHRKWIRPDAPAANTHA